jgi:hypothetical protein
MFSAARMALHIDSRIANYFFRFVVPEGDLLLQIEHTDLDLQAIENVALDLRILKGRHGAAAIWVLNMLVGGNALRLKRPA